jgi:hypothetical protein
MARKEMLRNTFCHIPGIGPKRERRLWSSGFRFWEDCSGAPSLPLPREAVDPFQDVVNLETLLVMAYNLNAQETPFAESHLLPLPLQPEIPYQPDRETIERIKARLYLPYPQGFH